MGTSAFGSRATIALIACAALLGADLLTSPGAVAQTVQPTCSNGGTLGGGTSESNSGSFTCIADLDGNGTLELIIGAQREVASGYVFILNFNGNRAIVRDKVCWGAQTACPSVVPDASAECADFRM